MSHWQKVCKKIQIVPGTGVCALVESRQVAIFRPDDSDQVFAIDNQDPFAQSNVLSRGIICEHNGELWVASPLKKQRFRLTDGVCMENKDMSVHAYSVRVNEGMVEIDTSAMMN